MNYNDKEISIKNVENSGMFEMLSKIFQSIANTHGNILRNNQNLKNQFMRLFSRFENDYKFSSRPDAFSGKKTDDEIREEAFDYGVSKTMKLLMAMRMFESDAFNSFIALSGKSPEEFLNAIKDILNPHNNGGSQQW